MGQTVKRGQLVTGRKSLAQETGIKGNNDRATPKTTRRERGNNPKNGQQKTYHNSV